MNSPLVFERVGRAQVAGCLVYMLLTPTFMGIAALIVGGICVGISHLLNLGKTAELWVLWVPTGLATIVAAWLCVRSFNRRKTARVEVGDDYIDCTGDLMPQRIRFEDLTRIKVNGLATLSLGARKGRWMSLRAEEWPIDKILEALQVRAVPQLVARYRDEVMDGREVLFRPAKVRAVWLFGVGLFFFLIAGVLGVRILSMMKSGEAASGRIGQLALLGGLGALGFGSTYQATQERRGFVISEKGIREQGKAGSERLWSSISQARQNAGGLTLSFEDGKRALVVGATRTNYVVMVALVKSLTPEEAWNPGPK